ncbi:MAG: hypothetical protein D3908_04310, partial [Candidatus Electrothrix sp. AUS4]|nr:hypothetical protein [Candidatus Electrothrix sp. AUS4]
MGESIMGQPKKQTLHFAFGPVQDFVSQARRTRDLWAGSYLLSWLAGHAMSALKDKGGEVIMPKVDNDPLFQQIRSPKTLTLKDQASYLGSLPNRFTVRVPDGVDGTVCTEAIYANWQRVTAAVHNFIKDELSSNGAEIWQRQTAPDNLWECTWVIGEAGYLLNHRKDFRIHFPRPEPGAKCTLCGEREELSDQRKRPEMNKWWQDLIDSIQRKHSEKIHGLDLKDNERLCAVCLTKRLFPHVAKQAIGWQVPEFYPSTLYMSAVDWIIHVLKLAKENDGVRLVAEQFLDTVQDRIVRYAEKQTWDKIAGIKELIESCPELTKLKKIQYVDGAVFYQDALQRKDLHLSNPRQVAAALSTLQNTVEK